MKKWFTTAGAALLCCTGMAAGNLLQNGDFASGKLAPWKSPQRQGKPVHVVVEGKLNALGDTKSKYNKAISCIQDLPVLEYGKNYVLSAKVGAGLKNTAGKWAKITVRQATAKDKSLAYDGVNIDLADGSMRNYSVAFTPRKGAEKFQLYIQHGNFDDSDVMLVDDISFSEMEELKPVSGSMVINGDFEYPLLTPWKSAVQGSKDRFFTLSSDTMSGKQCLAVSGDLKHRYNNFLTLIQELPVLKHDQEYVLSARAISRLSDGEKIREGNSSVGNRQVKVTIREVNGSNRTLRYTGFEVNLSDDSWQYYEKMFKIHKEAVKFQLYISSANLDKKDLVMIDDVKLGIRGDAGSPFDAAAVENVPVVKLEKDGVFAAVNKKNNLLHSLTIDGQVIQPGAKLGTVVAVEKDGREILLDGKKTPAGGFAAEAKYDFADGMFREVVTIEALQDFAEPVKLSVRHGLDLTAYKKQIGGLRPLRVLDAEKATIFSFLEEPNDLNPGVLDTYQHTAYPLMIMEGDKYYLLAGSRNMDDFVTISPNRPAGYIPSLQRNPKTVKKGDKFRFENNWKLFSRDKYMLRDVWRFYQDNLQTEHPVLKPFFPPKYPEKRHFYPGVFGSHTYFMKSREDRLPAGANIWFYSWHDNIRERYPISGEWWSDGNAFREKLSAEKVKKYVDYMQNERGFKCIMYLRQLANLRERERGAFPEAWYKREAGGALHLYGGGYEVKLPKNVADDVGYATIPWGHHNFGNPDYRAFYLKEIFEAINFYAPRAIGWDMGSNLDEFMVMAETYDRLRKDGGKVKVVANESAGPSQAYTDMVMLENGLLGGKSAYDFEIKRAYTTAVVCLERWNIFRLAFDSNMTGKKCWLNDKGLEENKRYLFDLLARRPELKNQRIEAARLCQLRASLFDLALGASPGYMEEAAPVPPTLTKVAGDVNGLFAVNKSFTVMFPNRSNVDGHKIVGAWNNDKSFRLVAFNDDSKADDFTVLLDKKYFAGENWSEADLKKAVCKAVAPEGENDMNVSITVDGDHIKLTFKLNGFTALILSADK
ncbi:MAG: carbohydrate binding domain-containing protein [Lentisphaeria bacterium]|nr:carbohydrate binding domain-containing protein [Lentisphaeria bacterium]